MADSSISAALQRVETAFTQKPSLALQNDAPAHAVFKGGLAMEVQHPSGRAVCTDMPAVLGGGGAEFPPGWLMRAGLASCTATVIAMRAERLGIRLTRLEVTASSRSDARGLLGLDACVPAGPSQLDMQVAIAADNADDQALAELVAWADAHSPVSSAVRRALELHVSVNGGPANVH